MNRKDKVLKVINNMIDLCEPIKFSEFNKIIKAKDIVDLRIAEANEDKIGLANYDTEQEGISTLSLIATITDLLCDERLAFIVDNDIILSVEWYKHNQTS